MLRITRKMKTITTYSGQKIGIPKRRTKFSRKKLSDFRPDEDKARQDLQEYQEFHQDYELSSIFRHTKPVEIGRFKVYFAEFSNPVWKQLGVYAHPKSRHVILDKKLKKMPSELLLFILKHEQREGYLKIAGYWKSHTVNKYNRAHKVAVAKEYRDLVRSGKLNELMAWVKKLWPEAYEERVRVWKLKGKV